MIIQKAILNGSNKLYFFRFRPTIAEVAVANSDLSTFANVIKAARVGPRGTQMLNVGWYGNLTVFAPNNAAFAKLSKGRLEEWARGEDNYMLHVFLRGHIFATRDRLFSKDLKEGRNFVTNINGIKLMVFKKGAVVTIHWIDRRTGDRDPLYPLISKVVKTDIKASNGVVHIIDSPIMPLAVIG